jgi:hypothetical protein
MNRKEARQIVEIISNDVLLEMFKKAKESITDWTVPSIVNKTMSKGCAWNILASDFNIENNYMIIAKINMVREFGNYLPEQFKPIKKEKQKKIRIVHYEPNFKNYEDNSQK